MSKRNAASESGLLPLDLLTPDELDMVCYEMKSPFRLKGSLKNEPWGRETESFMRWECISGRLLNCVRVDGELLV